MPAAFFGYRKAGVRAAARPIVHVLEILFRLELIARSGQTSTQR